MRRALIVDLSLKFLVFFLACGHAGSEESQQHITLYNEQKGREFPTYSLADYGFAVHSHLGDNLSPNTFVADIDKSILLYLGPDCQPQNFLGKPEYRNAAKRLLERGGTIIFHGISLQRPVIEAFLKEIDVAIPDIHPCERNTVIVPVEEGIGADHPILTVPFEQDQYNVSTHAYKKWSDKQIAPFRLDKDNAAAPLVLQENVLGKGRIIFCRLFIHDRDYGDPGLVVKNLLSYISGQHITGKIIVPAFKNYETKRDYVIWTKNPYAIFPLEKDAPEKRETGKLELKAAINEHISGMFLITIAPGKDQKISIEAMGGTSAKLENNDPQKGSPGITGVLSRERITVRELMFFADHTERWVADPMPEVTNAVAIPAGQTKAFWLDISTFGLKAGDYRGIIKVSPESGKASEINLALKVWPIELPAKNPMWFAVWDYVPCKHRDALVGGWDNWKNYQVDLIEHGVNVFVVAGFNNPYPVFDQEGNLTKPLDFTIFDQEIVLKEKGAQYLIPTPNPHAWCGEQACRKLGYITPAWEKMFRAWLKEMLAHLRDLGLDYDQFAFYPYDELWKNEDIPNAIKEYQIIKEVDPKAKIFLTLGTRSVQNFEKVKTVRPYIDIWCPGIPFYKHFVGVEGKRYENLINFCRATGKEIWSYENSGRGQAYDMTAYQLYRLKPWGAYRFGLTGYGFWAYNPWKGDPWQVFSKDGKAKASAWKDALSVVYSGPKPVPSIRWEALREGMNDIKYLAVLKDRIAKAKAKGIDKQTIAKAEELVNNSLKDVTETIDNPDLVYTYREKIVQAILALEKML